MPVRSCPSCGLTVAAHQTLCPACRTPIPSDPGPVAASAEGSSITVSAPPPRRGPTGADPASVPDGPDAVAPSPPGRQAPTAPDPGGRPPVDGSDPTVVVTDDPTRRDLVAAPEPTSRDPAPAARSAGTLGVPGAPALDDRGNLPGGLAALLGAAMVAVGVVLPWLVVAGESVSGWSASDDAKAWVALAALTLVVGALVVGGARSVVLRALLVLGGVGIVVLAVVDLLSVAGIEELEPEPGVGLYLGLAGGAVLLLSAALTRHRRFR